MKNSSSLFRNLPPVNPAAETKAALKLYHCLLQMADKNSNPVLLLLGEDEKILQGKKYPQQNILIGTGGMVAYYHCHAEPGVMENEHGHFHVFIKHSDAEADWTHLVALSIDTQGQPIRWFTVNHWVTAGFWLSAEDLNHRYHDILDVTDGQKDLLQEWLCAMLSLYQYEIGQLLFLRDGAVGERMTTDSDETTVLNDRQLYYLSEVQIDLLKKLGDTLGIE